MTKRLEDALKRLTPGQVEQITDYVEAFAGPLDSSSVKPGTEATMSWVGSLRGGPHRSGLEAQAAAKHYRLFLLERGMPR